MIICTIHISLTYVAYKQFSFYVIYKQFVDLSTRYAINKNCKPLVKLNTRMIVTNCK